MYRRLKMGPQGRNTAAALQYSTENDGAPKVVASGQGQIAEKIIELAKANGIPIHEDPVLAASLAMVNIGEEIPPELYRVVAEVLAYIYRVSGQKP